MIALDSLSDCQEYFAPAWFKDAPNGEVVVRVVDQRRDTPVRVILRVLGVLLVPFVQVEVFGLVRQPQLR